MLILIALEKTNLQLSYACMGVWAHEDEQNASNFKYSNALLTAISKSNNQTNMFTK